MSVLILDEHQVRSLLTMRECIEAMDEVLRSLAAGELHQPLRPVTRPDARRVHDHDTSRRRTRQAPSPVREHR